MSVERSAMILAGGEAKRVNGREKYFFSYKGCSFIARLVAVFSGITDEIVIVAKNEAQTAHFAGLPENVRCTWDKERGLGPIGGIASGIEEVKGKSVFIAACDMPTINRAVVSCLFDKLGSYDAVIPEWENSDMEPLHAVYNTDAVRRYLTEKKGSSLHAMVHSLNTLKIPPEELRKYDPELETFRNVNTLDDLLKMGPEASYQEKHPEK
ncbi:MAG TPA: molybdenum cofactor guanylyltransferase [Methanocorpusculum sp.]|nr:molybdenum cofactor guanylyltransferase [Methanocorpusculum sp.]